MKKMNKILTSKIGKSVLILIASIGVFFTIDYFTVSQEASAVVCEVGYRLFKSSISDPIGVN